MKLINIFNIEVSLDLKFIFFNKKNGRIVFYFILSFRIVSKEQQPA